MSRGEPRRAVVEEQPGDEFTSRAGPGFAEEEYLELSVGGTLVVGGVVGTTSAFGVVSDTVIEMDVVTGRGEKVTCSATGNADLFDAGRAGLGQVGMITSATLPLIAAPPQVRRFVLFYPDLAAMVNDAGCWPRTTGSTRSKGAVLGVPTGGWIFQLDVAKTFTGASPDNLLRIPTTDDPATAARLVDANEKIYRRVKDAGGTLYPVSAFPMAAGDWRQHFGSAFGRLREAKQKFDPDTILTPGYEIFV